MGTSEQEPGAVVSDETKEETSFTSQVPYALSKENAEKLWSANLQTSGGTRPAT
jgi:hypothetical protein